MKYYHELEHFQKAMIAYSKYKDSGIPWLGQIPEHWGTDKLGQLFAERREKCSDKEFQPLSVSKQGVTPQLDTAVKTDNGDNRKKVCAGDFVVNSRSDRKGAGGVSPLDGSVSLINTVLESRGKLIRPYIHYLLRSHYFIEEFYRWGRGIVADLWTTRYSEMKNIMLPVPPLAEQKKIVAFIDDKTSKIDRYIAEREKELQTLAELKQSEIAAAVTRGLNPNVPMKDSGIPWIGQIPEHWEMRRIKYIFSELKERSTTGEETALSLTKENGLIPSSEKQNKTMESESLVGCKIIHKGEVVFNRFKARLFAVSYYDGVVSSDYAVYSCNINAFARYMVTLFNTPIYREAFHRKASGIGDGFNRLYTDDLFAMYSIFPPLAEQRAIVEYIDSKCSEINSLISNIEAEIAYLKEYKQSLIADAVTGAINVQ